VNSPSTQPRPAPAVAEPAPFSDELVAERTYLFAARTSLRGMRERAEHLLEVGVGGDAYGAERLKAALAQRVAALSDIPSSPLFFGRLDLARTPAGDATRHYIGRRHVTDEDSDPLVLDWRAPVSKSFYQASVRESLGVLTRRRFGSAGGQLTSLEDEHLDRAAEVGAPSGILTAEIERPRVGPMRDIVATIQPEQDDLVRAQLSVSLCIQGGPGTGKTAVGLHRAAFLFYTHRQRLAHSGVLIVGPNKTLIAYISGVLPALGEIDAEQVSIDELYPAALRGPDEAGVAELKHDVRMASVLRRALWSRVAAAREPVTVSHGSYRYTVDASTLDEIVAEVLSAATTYGAGRERLRARVTAHLRREVELKRDVPSESWFRTTARGRPVSAFLDVVWPAVTPEQLLFGILADSSTLAAGAEGILSAEEQDLLRWARPASSHRAARWSAADAVLLEEAAGLIERQRTYGHVIVDEAQDLSPMQCRALARRNTHGSLTILGDLAQGTTPWATRSWRDTMAHLGKPDAAVVPLTTGFRVPQVVMAFANQLVPSLDLDVPVATSLRSDGSLHVRRVEDLGAACVDECRAALDAEGSVGLIVPDSLAESAAGALTGAGLAWSYADAAATERIVLVPASLAKGLEFDHVVAVEPGRIVAEEARGLNRLYVVLTRAVSRLVVVHREALPDALG
jgi:DNA helicase IV